MSFPRCRCGRLVPADGEQPSYVYWCERARWHRGAHRLGLAWTLDRQPRKVRWNSPLAVQRFIDEHRAEEP